MLKMLLKRPMARPLLVWITGILLQISCQIEPYSVLFLIFSLTGILFSWYYAGKQSGKSLFSGRAIWGIHLVLLLLFLSVQFTCLHQKRQEINLLPAGVFLKAENIRDKVLSSIEKLAVPDDQKAVLATITLGYRQALPKEVRNRFALTGTAHILAVSGMHVAIAYGFLSFVFALFPLKYKLSFLIYLLSLCLIWGYVLLTGYIPSAVRVGCMISLYLAGREWVKHTDGYNTLAAAAFCMLVVRPLYLFDIGFQLSFIAVFFILYLEPLLKIPLQTKNPLFSIPVTWITIACAAQAGVALLSIYYFGYTTLLFIFTAIPVSLLITFLLPVSLIWMVLPEWVPGCHLLQQGVEWLLHSLCEITDRFSRIESGHVLIRLSRGKVIAGYLILIGLIEYFRKQNRFSLQKSSTFGN